MKEIGKTKDGNVIVEMTDDEARAFELLEMATSDRLPGIMNQSMPLSGTDLAPSMVSIRAWVVAKFKLHEMREYLDQIEELLKDGDTNGG